MSRVPTAVRQQAQSVDDMIRANAASVNGQQADDIASDPAASDEHVARAPTADIVDFDQVSAADDGAEVVTTSMQDVALQQLDATAAEVEEYKQRWKSLDGQLRQRDAQLAQQADQIARLTELVGSMAEGQAARPAEPTVPAGVLASDADDFGEDMVTFVTRVAQAVVQQALSGVQTKVADLEHNVTGVKQSTAAVVRKSFTDLLSTLAPRYKEFDTDPAFHAWLEQSPTRHDAFYASVTRQDAEGVADFFNMFVSLLPPPKVDAAAGAQQQLERQVSPKKSSSAATVEASQSEPKIWTRSEIAANYKKQSRGGFTKEAWAALEREMSAAQLNERVDYTR